VNRRPISSTPTDIPIPFYYNSLRGIFERADSETVDWFLEHPDVLVGDLARFDDAAASAEVD